MGVQSWGYALRVSTAWGGSSAKSVYCYDDGLCLCVRKALLILDNRVSSSVDTERTYNPQGNLGCDAVDFRTLSTLPCEIGRADDEYHNNFCPWRDLSRHTGFEVTVELPEVYMRTQLCCSTNLHFRAR
jgi:hypothetical protein